VWQASAAVKTLSLAVKLEVEKTRTPLFQGALAPQCRCEAAAKETEKKLERQLMVATNLNHTIIITDVVTAFTIRVALELARAVSVRS
jgi:hypothetical protein